MRQLWAPGLQGWAMRAENLRTKSGSFDVITCLWNTLGHIDTRENRIEILRQCGRLLAPDGVLFCDVNNRYNARQYGLLRTTGRGLWDWICPGEANGDVDVRWDVAGASYSTKGHVFTGGEFRQMTDAAGLAIQEECIVDYGTGQTRRWRWAGNPLYTLRRR